MTEYLVHEVMAEMDAEPALPIAAREDGTAGALEFFMFQDRRSFPEVKHQAEPEMTEAETEARADYFEENGQMPNPFELLVKPVLTNQNKRDLRRLERARKMGVVKKKFDTKNPPVKKYKNKTKPKTKAKKNVFVVKEEQRTMKTHAELREELAAAVAAKDLAWYGRVGRELRKFEKHGLDPANL